MEYKIVVSPRALYEMEDAIDYYAQFSKIVPSQFIGEINRIYSIIQHHPFFSICYKNIRTIPLKGFPYSLYYVVDESLFIVRILACFHQHRHPKGRP